MYRRKRTRILTYNPDIHAKRLIRMFESSECCGCPVTRKFKPRNRPIPLARNPEAEGVMAKVCRLCKTFIKVPITDSCPCLALGKEEAVKRTWIALEEKGYLK